MNEETFSRLIEIMQILRAPEGCPWDKKQTPESITPHLLEETHEVIEAIDNGNWDELKEELGDLLLHVLFQAIMAEENNRFTLEDVLQTLIEKLVNRHPDIFSDTKSSSAYEPEQNWEVLKMEEGKKESQLDGVPKTLPALTRATRLQSKAASVGFDYKNIKDVENKVEEEWNEYTEACAIGDFDCIEAEFGDFLFALTNLARFLEIDPEKALRRTVDKFIYRFREIEKELKRRGKRPEDSSLEEMDDIWNGVKKRGR